MKLLRRSQQWNNNDAPRLIDRETCAAISTTWKEIVTASLHCSCLRNRLMVVLRCLRMICSETCSFCLFVLGSNFSCSQSRRPTGWDANRINAYYYSKKLFCPRLRCMAPKCAAGRGLESQQCHGGSKTAVAGKFAATVPLSPNTLSIFRRCCSPVRQVITKLSQNSSLQTKAGWKHSNRWECSRKSDRGAQVIAFSISASSVLSVFNSRPTH